MSISICKHGVSMPNSFDFSNNFVAIPSSLQKESELIEIRFLDL